MQKSFPGSRPALRSNITAQILHRQMQERIAWQPKQQQDPKSWSLRPYIKDGVQNRRENKQQPT